MIIILEIKVTSAMPVFMAIHDPACGVWDTATDRGHVTWKDCTCHAKDSGEWVRVGEGKLFIDRTDAQVWGERYYPTDVRRIREI